MNEGEGLLKRLRASRDRAQMEAKDLNTKAETLSMVIADLEIVISKEKQEKGPTNEKA